MHLASHRVLRRVSIYGAFLALLGFSAVSLTQCTSVSDSVTGPSESLHRNTNSCLKECKEDFARDTLKEFKRHIKALLDCKRDRKCKEEEVKRHRAAMDKIEAEYKKCRADCHHQGGGGGR